MLSGSALAAAALPAQAAQSAPVPNPIAVTAAAAATVAAGTDADIAVSAADSAGLPVTFSAVGLPTSGDLAITTGATVDGPVTDVATTSGAITGTPTTADIGSYKVVVTADDGGNGTGTADIALTITAVSPTPTVTVTVPADQATPAGTAITPVTATATGGFAPYTYAATGLPAGLALDQTTGEISGTPTTAGIVGSPHAVKITATDADEDLGANTFTWTITAASAVKVTAPAKTQAYTGVAVDIKPGATDTAAKSALTWSAAGLPPGLAISKSTGAITGRPSKAGKYDAVKLTATDAAAKAAGTLTVAIVVSYPFDILNPGTRTTTVGKGLDLGFSYSVALKGVKVTSLSARNLPAGMGFQAKPAMLYGWPAKAGTYSVVINGSGTSGATSTMTFKLVVKAAPDSGATGQVHLALGGKCLLDPDGKTANGTKAEISNCVSGSTEKWTVASDATLRVNGRCLDIAGTGGYSGRVAELWSCDGSAREQWAQGTDGELVNPASGVCLTDPGSATRNGTAVQTGGCRVRSSEQWTLPAQPILTSLGGSCADDFHSIGSNGAKVDMFWCNGTPGQAWIFRPNGTISIGQYPNVCLTVHDSKIQLWLCGRASGQNWAVVRTGTMSSELKASGVCLGIPSLTGANSSALIAAKCTASDPRVHWHIA